MVHQPQQSTSGKKRYKGCNKSFVTLQVQYWYFAGIFRLSTLQCKRENTR